MSRLKNIRARVHTPLVEGLAPIHRDEDGRYPACAPCRWCGAPIPAEKYAGPLQTPADRHEDVCASQAARVYRTLKAGLLLREIDEVLDAGR